MKALFVGIYLAQLPIAYLLLSKVILPRLGVTDPENRFRVIFTYFSSLSVVLFAYLTQNLVASGILLLLTLPVEAYVTRYLSNRRGWLDNTN